LTENFLEEALVLRVKIGYGFYENFAAQTTVANVTKELTDSKWNLENPQ
jgi:hypothetical protein